MVEMVEMGEAAPIWTTPSGGRRMDKMDAPANRPSPMAAPIPKFVLDIPFRTL